MFLRGIFLFLMFLSFNMKVIDPKVILKFKDLEIATLRGNFQIAALPFANGALRKAFYAQRLFPERDKSKATANVPGDFNFSAKTEEIVAKTFIKIYEQEKEFAKSIQDMETQAISKYLAMLFNHNLKKHRVDDSVPRMKVLLARVIKFLGDAEPQVMSIELKFKGIDAVFEKYTSNSTYVKVAVDSEHPGRIGKSFSSIFFRLLLFFCFF